MLCGTHRRRQPAGGPAGSAPRAPRCAGTTASAAPPTRSDQGVAAPDLRGAGPGLGPEGPSPTCVRIFRMTAGSWSVAIRRSRPPQRGHARTSMANARSMRAAQVQARGVGFTPASSGPAASGAKSHPTTRTWSGSLVWSSSARAFTGSSAHNRGRPESPSIVQSSGSPCRRRET